MPASRPAAAKAASTRRSTRNADQPRALGVGADGEEFAARRQGAQNEGDEEENDERDEDDARHAKNFALVMSSQACGTWSALICLPPVHRLSRPRNTESVPSVTTIAGTRPRVTTSPLSSPQARPMPAASAKPQEDVEIGMGLQGHRRAIGRKTDDRGDREIDVARDQDEHLCCRDDHEQCGIHRERDEIGRAEHARVDRRHWEHDCEHRGDQAELALGKRGA